MGLPTLALGAQAASPILGGLGARADAKAQQQQAEINAYIGKTRAIQTDTAARESLNAELATFRATLAANGQKQNVGTDAVATQIRDVRSRERRVEVNNRNQEASAYRMQAQAYKAKGRAAMIGGIVGAGQPLFDIYDMRRKLREDGIA